MKNPKLWIWTGIAGFMLACALAFAPYARATDKPQIIPPPKTVVMVEKERDYTAGLIAAGIGLWIMHRRAKRREPKPLVLDRQSVDQAPPSTCEPVVERVLEACGVSK